MADIGGEEAHEVSVPTVTTEETEASIKADPKEGISENDRVLLTQRENTNISDVNLPEDQQVTIEINAIADEVVKSSIDLAVSEHEQDIAHSVRSMTDQVVTDTAMQAEIRERAMSLADKVVTGAAEDEDNLAGLEDMGADSVFEYSGDTYLQPLPDPYTKAISYLEKHNILQLFQGLTSNVVLHQPTDPLESMLEQLQLLRQPETSDQSIDLSQMNREESAVM